MKKKNTNPDNVTGKPGSHPIGTGIGAAAGGAAAAGAGLGAAAGPAGAAAGAAAGAVVGGLAGHAAGEAVNPTDIHSFLGQTVIDKDEKKVGTINSIWEDHSHQPAFLGVKTGWLGMGKEHIIPAYSAQANPSKKRIKVPYSAEVVKNAPSFDSQTDINEAVEDDIYGYYKEYGIDWDRDRNRIAPYESPPESNDVNQDVNEDMNESANTNANEDGNEDVNMTLKGEEIKVGKRQVEDGGVRLRKIIRTEEVNVPVELEHEEVVVERLPAEDKTNEASGEFKEEDVFIPLRHEEPVVEKRAYNREEVQARKKIHTEQHDISDTVRQEDVEVQEDHGENEKDRPQ